MSLAAPPIRSPLKKKPANLNRGPDQQNAGLQPGKKRKSPATGTGTHHNTAALVFESTTTATARPPASKRAKKDEAQREAIRQETVEWRRRYKKAFRSFSFYFDHLHSSKNTDLTKACLQLGATVENFFSNKVTHIVSSRTSALDKENAGRKGHTARPKSPARPRNIKQSPGGMPEDELFAKAQDMGIKIWSIEKVDRVLNELLDGNSPTKSASSKAPSLPHLLRAEQLSGITLERDPDIERPDYNYFSPRSYYILVEDASGEHRTVIAKEYDRPRRGDNGEWPILHGGVEGRVAFTAREQAVPPLPKGNSRPTVKQPARPAAAANTLLAPPKPSHNGGGNGLRRSASLNNFNKSLVGSFNKRLASAAAADFLSRKKTLPDAAAISGEQDANAAPEEYVAASGNSQPLTSNIASVTSGAPYSAQPHGNTQAGVMLDARLAQLNKRQILINRVGLGQQNSLPVPNPRPGKLGSNARRTSAEGLKNKNPAKPNEPVKPGYCENCRVRYEDFKDHILSRRHRKFALDADNWADLDEFLDNIPRPILSYYRNKAKAEVCEETSEEGSGSERSYDEADEDMEPVYDQQSDDEDRERQEYLAGINGYDDTNSDGEQAEREPSDIDEDEQQNHGEEDIDMEGTIRDQPQSPCSTKSKSSASEGEYYAAVTQSPSVSPV